MLSLSDALPMQNYPSKIWFLCVAVQISMRQNVSPTDVFFYMKSVVYIMADKMFTSVLPSYLSDVHFNS